LALDADKLFASRPGRFTPEERTAYPLDKRLVSGRTGLEGVEARRKILPRLESDQFP
jgi:hypothetical protein